MFKAQLKNNILQIDEFATVGLWIDNSESKLNVTAVRIQLVREIKSGAFNDKQVVLATVF